MINGSFVFGFDCDGPDVFERTLEFTVENKILTASFHVLTPLPGTRAFERLDTERRLLHRDWCFYDTCHAVFRPRRMTPEQLDAGYCHAKRQFATCGSILRRSLGLPGALKRIAYNVAWMKMDPLWVAIIRMGLMPFATQIFERVLQLSTTATSREDGRIVQHRIPAPCYATNVPAVAGRQSLSLPVLNAGALEHQDFESSAARLPAESDQRRQTSSR
jgi:hypothetical protein